MPNWPSRRPIRASCGTMPRWSPIRTTIRPHPGPDRERAPTYAAGDFADQAARRIAGDHALAEALGGLAQSAGRSLELRAGRALATSPAAGRPAGGRRRSPGGNAAFERPRHLHRRCGRRGNLAAAKPLNSAKTVRKSEVWNESSACNQVVIEVAATIRYNCGALRIASRYAHERANRELPWVQVLSNGGLGPRQFIGGQEQLRKDGGCWKGSSSLRPAAIPPCWPTLPEGGASTFFVVTKAPWTASPRRFIDMAHFFFGHILAPAVKFSLPGMHLQEQIEAWTSVTTSADHGNGPNVLKVGNSLSGETEFSISCEGGVDLPATAYWPFERYSRAIGRPGYFVGRDSLNSTELAKCGMK